jgi:chemotaxis methyl-accepting protein methylase
VQGSLPNSDQVSEPLLDEPDLLAWARLIEAHTGLRLTADWMPLFRSRLRARMEQLQITSFADYYHRLDDSSGSAREWAELIDTLTFGETWFFRHQPSLDLVASEVKRVCLQRAGSNARLEYQIWSVGCASGEEAYSLAMIADGVMNGIAPDHYLGVTATDLNDRVLAAARSGQYMGHRLRGLPGAYRENYISERAEGRYQIDPALKRRVCFTRYNVLDQNRGPWGEQDLVYCQNMLIYFEPQRRLQILDRLAGYVRPGGLLVSLPGEVAQWRHPDFLSLAHEHVSAFRRIDSKGQRRLP